MAIYALIDSTNIIDNIIVWDGITKWTQPTGMTPILITEDVAAGIGYTYDATTNMFTAPSETISTSS